MVAYILPRFPVCVFHSGQTFNNLGVACRHYLDLKKKTGSTQDQERGGDLGCSFVLPTLDRGKAYPAGMQLPIPFPTNES